MRQPVRISSPRTDAVALVGGLALGALAWRRFDRFTITSWDNAIFEQALQGYARFGAPIVDIKGPGFNILGDHFSPIYALLGPIYRLFPAAQTLLIAQVVLIAFSAAVIGRLAHRHLSPWVAVGVTAAYIFSFGVQSAVAVDFHEVAFGAPLLALAGAAWVDRRPERVVAWSLPLLLVKEDLGVTVVVIGLLLWWAGERRRGQVLAAVGALGLVVTIVLILPSFNSTGTYAYTGNLGGDAGLLGTLFTSAGTKLGTLALTFAVTGLAALFSPWAWLVVPTFAWRFAGDVSFYWGTAWHYSLLLMPIVFVAGIDAAVRHRERLSGRSGTWIRRGVLSVGALTAVATLVTSPLREAVDPDFWRDTPRMVAAREAIAALPDGDSVETDIALLPHVVTDHEAYWTGTIATVEPQHVLFDTLAGIGSPADPLAYALGKYGGDWRVTFADQGIVLVSRF